VSTLFIEVNDFSSAYFLRFDPAFETLPQVRSPTPPDLRLVDAAGGLTTLEAENAFALSLVETGAIAPGSLSGKRRPS
jgi:hypothetical protein